MMKIKSLLIILAVFATYNSEACTNILITKGASKTGSTMVSYSADSHVLYGELYNSPARNYPSGAVLKIHDWDSGLYLGEIPQVKQTYSTIGNMNEHQLVIAESTWGGREELVDTTGIIDYGSLIYITLQRAKTAREAIAVMADLVEKYGYYSSGESISIADANEVWVFEIIGKGSGNKGAVWVAVRIPDGYISAHANHARITTFPLNDPENCLYAKDVISFAREKGYFKGEDKDFSFTDAYAIADYTALRGCEARVWSVFSKVCSGMEEYTDYALGNNPKNRMPLYVKAERKVDVKDVISFMRDHYEDTPLDMRNDIGAGGSKLPYRWRPMTYEVDGATYMNERAIATQQTGFWFVGEARSWLPDMVGGILWFAVDDAGTSCPTPIYSSSSKVPECFAVGNGHIAEYSPTSAFWLFSRVTNFAYMRYDMISTDILKVANKFIDDALTEIVVIDADAEKMYAKNPESAREFLTNYSSKTAQNLFNTWDALDKYLLVKYMDGNVKKEKDGQFLTTPQGGNRIEMPNFPGYNDTWKRAVVKDAGERLKVIE